MIVSLDLSDTSAASRRTAHEYVRDTLRQAILRGSVTGGTRLVQADIAARLGVSTTPVREALRDLATEGLIHLDAHRGAVVRELTYEELVEIYDMLSLLEPEAMRRAALERDEEACARAGALADEMEQERDVGKWADLNRQFHAVLVECVPNRRLLSTLTALRDTAAPYVGLALQQRGYPHDLANKQHQQLVEALRAGDAEKVFAIATDHTALAARTFKDARELFEAAAVTEEGPVADALIGDVG
jgi:DNA-binding GntR family transcriptional regulator